MHGPCTLAVHNLGDSHTQNDSSQWMSTVKPVAVTPLGGPAVLGGQGLLHREQSFESLRRQGRVSQAEGERGILEERTLLQPWSHS
jgi:hypothetical protein